MEYNQTNFSITLGNEEGALFELAKKIDFAVEPTINSVLYVCHPEPELHFYILFGSVERCDKLCSGFMNDMEFELYIEQMQLKENIITREEREYECIISEFTRILQRDFMIKEEAVDALRWLIDDELISARTATVIQGYLNSDEEY
jgi:hypothetical protein